MADLNTLSLSKLRDLAKTHGLKNITKHSKSNLINLIEEIINNKNSISSSDDEKFVDTPTNRISFYDLPDVIQDHLLYGTTVSILNESYSLLCNHVYVKLLLRVWLSSLEDHALVVVYKPHCIIGELTSYRSDLFVLKKSNDDEKTYIENIPDGMKMIINKNERSVTNVLPDGKTIIHNHQIYDTFMVDATNKILRRTFGVACNPLTSSFITFKDMEYLLEKECNVKRDIVRVFKRKHVDERYAILVVSTSAFWIKLFPTDDEKKLRGSLGNIKIYYDVDFLTASLETS